MSIRTSSAVGVLAAAATLFVLALPSIASAAGPWYVDANNTSGISDGLSDATAFTTISAAVAAASAGDTINVAAGIYTENVDISKAITIDGANSGISAGFIPGARGPESVVNGGFDFKSGSSGAVVDGFTISGGHSIASPNRFDGVFVESPSITVANNIIKGAHSLPTTSSYGIELKSGSNNNLIVQNNEITANDTGIYLNPASGATISGNSIHDNSGTGTGIGSSGQSNFTLSGNHIYNQAEGWGIDTVGSNVAAHNNSFTNNTKSVDWYSGSAVDASQNWWGSATLATIQAQTLGSVTVNPYFVDSGMTTLNTTVPTTFYVKGSYTDGNAGGHAFGYDAFTTIQAAMNAATAGDTINVGAGTYNESPIIATSTTFKGAGAGSTTINGEVQVDAPSTTVSGFTITNPSGNFGVLINNVSNVSVTNNSVTNVGTSLPSSSASPNNAYGIYFQSHTSGSASNITISNNTINGVGDTANTHNSNGAIGAGDTSATGILSGLVIDNNTISNVSDNESTYPTGKGAYGIILNYGANAGGSIFAAQVEGNSISGLSGNWAHGLGMETDTSNAVVENNSFSNLAATGGANSAAAINFDQNPDSATVNINHNSFDTSTMQDGVTSSIPTNIDASSNYWNTGNTNPSSFTYASTTTNVAAGTINVTPWYVNSAKTILSNTVAPTPNTTTGAVTVTASTPNLVVASSTQAITIAASTVANASVDVSSLGIATSTIGTTTVATVVIPAITVNSSTAAVVIPATTITSSDPSWNGTITLPTVVTTTVQPTPGQNETINPSSVVSIEVGASDASLTFDAPVELTFPGDAGQSVGWSRSGVPFHEITTICDSATNPTVFSTDNDCKIDSGSDLIVWTKHFTTFTTYSQSAPGGGGGSGGSSSSSSSGSSSSVAVSTPSTVSTPAVTAAPTTTNPGQVLGAAVYNFTADLSVGKSNADVSALQQFLIDEGYSISAGATGYFGAQTKAAVIAFQKANGISQTGYVGPLTRGVLNKGEIGTTVETSGSTGSSGLTSAQVSAIVSLLQSFGADSATIAKVQASLQ